MLTEGTAYEGVWHVAIHSPALGQTWVMRVGWATTEDEARRMARKSMTPDETIEWVSPVREIV